MSKGPFTNRTSPKAPPAFDDLAVSWDVSADELIASNNAQPRDRRHARGPLDHNPEGASDLSSARIADPLGGYVSTDNIETLGTDELGAYLGRLSPASLLAVHRAVAIALGLP